MEPKPLPLSGSPYPGLRPFEESDALVYFGREDQVAELLLRLERHRFVAVVGSSGSGKSSLVRAGLLPALRCGDLAATGSHWRVCLFRPGDRPLEHLSSALAQALPSPFGPPDLTRDSLSLAVYARQHLDPGERLLVVIDQFEEIFRYRESVNPGRAAELWADSLTLVQLLSACCRLPSIPVCFVLNMRSDYLGNCADFRDLPELLNNAQYLVPRMSRAQLKEAIECPAFLAAASVSPALTQRLLNDAGDDPFQLPILQHALMRTWNVARSRAAQTGQELELLLDDYLATGGMRQALDLHASEVFQGFAADPALQWTVAKVFQRLTVRSSDGRDSRRPETVSALAAVCGEDSADRVLAVVRAFQHEGFLTSPIPGPILPSSVIDITHESLMTLWSDLRAWVRQESDAAGVYLRLADAAERHGSHYRDPELSEARNWRDGPLRPNVTWANRYHPGFDAALQFLTQSIQDAEDEAVRLQNLARREHQRELAMLRQRRRFAFLLSGILLVLLAVSCFLLFRARQASQAAELAKNQVLSRSLPGFASRILQGRRAIDPAALLVGLASQHALPEDASLLEASLLELSSVAPASHPLLSDHLDTPFHNKWISALDWSPSLQKVLSASLDGSVGLFDTRSKRFERLLRLPKADEITCLRVTPSGKSAFLGTLHGALYSLDLEGASAPAGLQLLARAGSEITGIASLDESSFLTSDASGRILQWSLSSPKPTLLTKLASRITSIAIDASRRRIVVGSHDLSVRLWSLGPAGLSAPTSYRHKKVPYVVAISPDGSLVASGGADALLYLHSAQNLGSPVKPVSHHPGVHFTSLAFSPSGRLLAAGRGNNAVQVWRVDWLLAGSPGIPSDGPAPQGSPTAALERPVLDVVGHSAPVKSLVFAGESLLASGAADSTQQFWDLSDRFQPEHVLGRPIWFLAQMAPDRLVTREVGQHRTSWNIVRGGDQLVPSGLPSETPAANDHPPPLLRQKARPSKRRREPGPSVRFGRFPLLALSESGHRQATLPRAGFLRVSETGGREPETGKEKEKDIRIPLGLVRCVRFSPDARFVGLCVDRSLVLVDVQRESHSILARDEGNLLDLAFTTDWIVFAGQTRGVQALPLDGSASEPSLLGTAVDPVTALGASPDGWIAAGTQSGTILLWHYRFPPSRGGGPALVSSISVRQHYAPVSQILFVPSISSFVAADFDGALRSLPVGPAMRQRLCRILWRPGLTRKEIARYLAGEPPLTPVCPAPPSAPSNP